MRQKLTRRYQDIDYISLSWAGSLRFHFDDSTRDFSFGTADAGRLVRRFSAHGVRVTSVTTAKIYFSIWLRLMMFYLVIGLAAYACSLLTGGQRPYGDWSDLYGARPYIIAFTIGIVVKAILDKAEDNDSRENARNRHTGKDL